MMMMGGGGKMMMMKQEARRLMLMVWSWPAPWRASQSKWGQQPRESSAPQPVFPNQAKLFSSKDAYSALTSSATILEQSRQKENAETNRWKLFFCEASNTFGRNVVRGKKMVRRIPAEQFSSPNDPCYCLRVDWVHREPEDFHIILIIVTTTIIIALSSIVGKGNLLNFMFFPQVSFLFQHILSSKFWTFSEYFFETSNYRVLCWQQQQNGHQAQLLCVFLHTICLETLRLSSWLKRFSLKPHMPRWMSP